MTSPRSPALNSGISEDLLASPTDSFSLTTNSTSFTKIMTNSSIADDLLAFPTNYSNLPSHEASLFVGNESSSTWSPMLNSNISEDFHAFPTDSINLTSAQESRFMEKDSVKFGLVLVHSGTLITLCGGIKMMWDRVDLNHPVFAVLFQELCLLAFCELIGYLSLLFMMTDFASQWRGIFLVTSVTALQFHQGSWLCVTCLRYYLLVHRKDSELHTDMARLKRTSLAAVWLFSLPYMIFCQSVSILSLIKSQGFPQVTFSEMDTASLIAILTVSNILTNVPDLVSIFIFVLMFMHFKKSIVPNLEHEEEIGPNGIWVGQGNEVVQANQEQEYSLNNNLEQDEQEHKANQVMKTLKVHISVCLVDFVCLLCGSLFFHSDLGRIMMFLYQICCCFWIPFLVVKTSFKQLDGMAMHLFKLACDDQEAAFQSDDD